MQPGQDLEERSQVPLTHGLVGKMDWTQRPESAQCSLGFSCLHF
jgi:hypothetical protein